MNFEVSSQQEVEFKPEQRSKIINHLHQTLGSNPAIIAALLEGADAHQAVDEYSDIDVRVIYEGNLSAAQSAVESSLGLIGIIDYKYVRPEAHGIRVLMHCAGTPKYLLADVLLQPYLETEKMSHNNKVVLFDKRAVVSEDFDEISAAKIRERIEKIKANKALRDIYVEREIKRGNFLEALQQYQTLVLQPLVEILRLRYCPQYKDLQLKHITKDLPPAVVAQLEGLYRVGSIAEIIEKKEKADELFLLNSGSLR